MILERDSSSAERHETLNTPQEVIAVYPWAVAMPDRILEDLHRGITPSTIRILLGLKPSDTGTPAAGMISPMRAWKNGEEDVEAVIHAIHADTTLFTVPIDPKRDDRGVHISDATFEYGLEGRLRNLTVAAAPVLPPRIAKGYLTFSHNQEGMVSILPLTPAELDEAMVNGQYQGYPLVESGSKIEPTTPGVVIDEENGLIRDGVLDRLSHFFRTVDRSITGAIAKRAFETASSYINLGELPEGADLASVYRHIRHNYSEERPEIADRIIQEAVEYVRNALFLDAYRTRESAVESHEYEGGDKLAWLMGETRAHFNNGTYGLDTLEIAAIETLQATSDRTGEGASVLNETTKTHELFESLWNETFTEALRKAGLQATDCFASRGAVTTKQQSDNLTHVSEIMIDLLGQSVGMDHDFAMAAVVQSFKFIPDMASQIESMTDIATVYQAHDLKNEVQSAQLAKLYHNSIVHENPKIRLESKRQLILILKTMFAMEVYNPIIERGNEYFDAAINEYFGQPDGGSVDATRFKKFDTRRGLDGRSRVIDKKPTKSLASFTRVSMQKSPEDIADVFAYSIVDKDGYGDDYSRAIEENHKSLIGFAQYVYTKFNAEGCEVTLKGHKTGGVENFTDWLEGHHEIHIDKAKRAGSKREMIVREKAVIQIRTPEGIVYNCEFSFYPFTRLSGKRAKLAEARQAGFMGWGEKFTDDRRYLVDRVADDLSGLVGLRSLYEYMFPAPFNPQVAHVKRERKNLKATTN
jgi:hypothetical protein